jgi:hypothetical protein
MEKFEPYKTDHLFLLVGPNPLPNYVAALLLAKEDCTVYLLHSGSVHGTEGVSDRLKIALESRMPHLKICSHEVDEVDSCKIVQSVDGILKELPSGASVGLHYTGGTKAMAIHANRAIERVYPLGVFSNLDARTLSVIIDGRSGVPTRSIPVGNACDIRLEELLALHGKSVASPKTETALPHVSEELAELHSKQPYIWRKWCRDNLRRPDNHGKFKNKTLLRSVRLPGEPPLSSIFETMRRQSDADSDISTLGDISSRLGWKIDKLAEWLDGKWLEHYVLDAVKQVSPVCHLNYYGMTLKPASSEFNFEFDVAVMLGYQLFALSCTTSDLRSLCKSKLFEAYVRARQIGGEEARISLICCVNDPDSLLQEVRESWFTEGRVRVFGRRDLPNLSVLLREWFETANQSID